VKTDSPDPADFAMTWHLIWRLWHFAQWLGRQLAYRAVTFAICQRSAQGALPDMPQPADFGVFFCAGRDMPTVATTVAQSTKNRQWIRCRAVAKSAGSKDPVLTLMGALL
jgi:hypothetical protein